MSPTALLFQFSIAHALLTFLPALVNLCIAVYVFFYLPRNKTTEIFGLGVLALMFWQVADGLYQGVETARVAILVDKVFSVSWLALAPLGFHFACRYTGSRLLQSRVFFVFTYGPFFILHRLYISFVDEQRLLRDPVWGWVITPGTHGVEVVANWAVSATLVLMAALLLRHALRLPRGERRMQAWLIAGGALVPVVGGILLEVVFPVLLGRNELPLTSGIITFFSIAVITALSRYRLFDPLESLTIDTLLQQVQHLVFLVTPDRQVRALNAFTRRQFGQGAEALSLPALFQNEARCEAFLHNIFEPALAGNPQHNRTVTFVNGERPLRTLLSAEPVRSGSRVQAVLIVANDLTGYLDLVDELKQSNQRYRLISRASNDMVWDWDLGTGRIYRSKEGWQKIFHHQAASDTGSVQDWQERMHPEDRHVGDTLIRSIEDGTIGPSFDIEFRMLLDDGSVLHMRDRGYVIRDESGRAVRLVGATQDISEQKRAAGQLAAEVARRHHEVTEAVIAAQENERRIIGAELHDNVNQILTSAKLYLGLTASAGPEERRRFLEQTGLIIGQAMQEVRKLSHSLIPPTLSGETLVEAMRHLLQGPAPAGFDVELDVSRFDEEGVPPKLKLTVYRIVQEQWSNIIKHASAKQVTVSLRTYRNELLLQVRDDGVGFELQQQARGVGLKNISTRAQLHGGRVSVQSAPGKGCTLRVEFPLSVAAFSS